MQEALLTPARALPRSLSASTPGPAREQTEQLTHPFPTIFGISSQ